MNDYLLEDDFEDLTQDELNEIKDLVKGIDVNECY